jgi:hypothetical protein
MSEKNIILEEDAEGLIELVNLEAWKVNEQKYFIKKEKAIEYVITHKKCECGELMDKYRSLCHHCQTVEWNKKYDERYSKMPFKEWDGKTYLVTHDGDKFFCDEGEIEDYLVENEMKLEDLKLCICEPNHLPKINYDELCEDIMPENQDALDKLCPEVLKKIDELNEFISNQPPISWTQGTYRTTVTL